MKKEELSQQDYDKILRLQGGGCPICGREQSQLKRKMAIDHSHKDGRVRGILCGRCNMGLGQFDDNCIRLERAIKYLKTHFDWEYTTNDIKIWD